MTTLCSIILEVRIASIRVIHSMKNKLTRFYWKLCRRVLIFWDLIRGVDFARNHTMEEFGLTTDIGVAYSASPSHDLRILLGKSGIRTTDIILDYGAGKGAAMVAMSAFPFQQIHGVEISKELSDIANKNFHKLGIKNAIVFHSSAESFTDLDGYNYFYLFNPFPTVIFQRVLQNIEDSYVRRPRKITLIYYNPSYSEVFDSFPFLKLIDSYMGRYFAMEIYNTTTN